MSWVSKFHNCFLGCSETKASCIWGLLVLSFIESSIPMFQHFNIPVCWSVNCMSWVFNSRYVQKLKIDLYLRPFTNAIYGKFDLYCLYLFNCTCTILVCKLCFLFQTILDLWPVLILEVFSIEMSQRVKFLVTFLTVFFLVFKLYKSGLYITTYFGHGQCFIWAFSILIFLLFNVFKNLKSNHHQLFHTIFPVAMLQF